MDDPTRGAGVAVGRATATSASRAGPAHRRTTGHLYEATHENVQLAVHVGNEVVYVEWLSGRFAVGVHIRAGARWPPHATGVGLALLAHGDPGFQEEYRAGPPASFTPYTITEPALLRRTPAEVRRSGVAVSDRRITSDALSVAAPVRGPDGVVSAAVSVVVPQADARVPVLIPAVRLAARGIFRALGRQPGPEIPLTGEDRAPPPS
ncbi:IclR family transcriptional regulator C-terminal domain-containing protein [Streptomyces griseoloalbus]|uniref:IclR family transcriptional regulator C-terminal domain-containing protein n=1 Tax=Streptomyces griseoloalbus TaxID=67303 RepID=A0ABV3EG32_9ACTN